VLDAGDRIIEVTGEYIAIVPPQATRVPLCYVFGGRTGDEGAIIKDRETRPVMRREEMCDREVG
jgi:hypothetical protein